MLRRSLLQSLIALVVGVFVTSPTSGAHAIPSCPAGATLVTTNQTFVTPHSGTTCVAAGVVVSIDIQVYSTATIFTAANVGVDVETYQTATIHILGGTIGADVDSYGGTINLFGGNVLGYVTSYGGTINVWGGDIGNRLLLYDDGHINVFARSLSSHAFGDVWDATGTIEGTFDDGSAFAFDFTRFGTEPLSLVYIPEPDTFALLGFAVGGLAFVRRWRPRRTS